MDKKNEHKCFVKNEANTIIKDISVKLVRLEDDSKLLVWIANNLKTYSDFKILKQQIADTTQQKTFIKKIKEHTYVIENPPITKESKKMAAISKKSFQKGKKVARKKSKLKQGLYKVNKNRTKTRKFNVARQKYKLDKTLSSVEAKIESDGSLCGSKFVEKDYANDNITYQDSCNGRIPSISNLSFDFTEEFSCNSHSQKCISNSSSFRKPKEDQSDLKDHKSIEFSEKEIKNGSVPMDVEESLSLISQLTGCSVNPLKVKLLPLSDVSEKIECDIVENGPEKNSITETPSSLSPPMRSKTPKISKNNCEHDFKENRNSNMTNVRTIYDLMNDFSAILPSWNLHILSDTNTFCIGQVTRNKFGIPYLAKSIELDDNFNAKVYVYQQHCKKFDGTYDSEDMVKALIYEVNHH